MFQGSVLPNRLLKVTADFENCTLRALRFVGEGVPQESVTRSFN